MIAWWPPPAFSKKLGGYFMTLKQVSAFQPYLFLCSLWVGLTAQQYSHRHKVVKYLRWIVMNFLPERQQGTCLVTRRLWPDVKKKFTHLNPRANLLCKKETHHLQSETLYSQDDSSFSCACEIYFVISSSIFLAVWWRPGINFQDRLHQVSV